MSLTPTLTVDLEAITANWRALDALSAPHCETGAVVKADAYGCRASRVGPALAAAGARTFYVATLDEAHALRSALGAGPRIYVLGGISATKGDWADAIQAAIQPVVNSVEQLHEAAQNALAHDGLSVAVQIDTGMNRLGIEVDDLTQLLADPRDAFGQDRISVDFVMSHMGCADDPENPVNEAQRLEFDRLCAMFDTQYGPVKHSLSATAGILLGPGFHHDLTRAGIGLYGGAPFNRGRHAVTLEVPIIQIRDVRPGEVVGYGAAWQASRASRIATIGAGYADGLIRALGGGATGFVNGHPAPFAGRVSMDLITLDVTDCPCRPGDAVEILGPNQSIDDLARAAGTIGHEILTSLGNRYARP